MPLIPPISDDFNYPDGHALNWDTIIGEIPTMPVSIVNIFPAFPEVLPGIIQFHAGRHIDIRNFDETSTIIARSQFELNQYHQGELAFIQTIYASTTPDAGSFQLIWYNDEGISDSRSLPFNTTVDQVQEAIDQLVGANSAIVTSQSGTFPFTITFKAITHIVTFQVESLLTNLGASVPMFVQIGDPDKPDKLFLQTADPIDSTMTMAELKERQTVSGEIWEMSADSTGYTTVGNLVVGGMAAFNNWHGAQIILSNAVVPFDIKLVSRNKSHPIDLTPVTPSPAEAVLTSVFPNFPKTLVDTDHSWVQFTSDPQGKFLDEGGSGQDSAKVFLTPDKFFLNITSYFMNILFSSFTSTWDDPSIAWNRVTGVRYRFLGNSTPPNGDIITIMGLVIATSPTMLAPEKLWFPKNFDIETNSGRLTRHVAFNGNPGLSTTGQPVLMRSAWPASPATDDPRPSDIAIDLKFNTGSQVKTGSFNRIMVFLREVQDSPQTTSFLVGELNYNANDIRIHRYRIQRQVTDTQIIDTNKNSAGGITTVTNSMNGSTPAPGVLAPLTPNTNYKFEVEALSNGMRVAIYKLDTSGAVVSTHYETDFAFSDAFLRTAGRVGFWYNPIDFDAYIDSFDSQSEVFSIIRTKKIYTHTPVDGAQLFVEASENVNEFNGFVSVDPFDSVESDQQRTLSGNSFRFVPGDREVVDRPAGMAAGLITIVDWRHTSLSFDIWIPQSLVSDDNLRPAVYFKNPNGDLFTFDDTIGPIDLDVIPNVWTRNTIDLSRFDKRPTGTYYMWIASQRLPADSWWIDNISLERLAVDWQMRAIEDGAWTSFGRMLNDNKAALHLPPELRGRTLQLQAKSLVQDAWISSYKLEPHYAELGRLVPQPMLVFEDSTAYSYSDISDSTEEYVPDTERPVLGGLGLAIALEEYTTHNL